MGMFDTVYFDCPECGIPLGIQSKAGDCNLSVFRDQRIPTMIAAEINHDEVYCDRCKIYFEIQYVDKMLDMVPMELKRKY